MEGESWRKRGPPNFRRVFYDRGSYSYFGSGLKTLSWAWTGLQGISICENSLEFTCSFWIIPREGEVGAQVREALPVSALLLLGY